MAASLRTLGAALALFRDLDPEVPATTILCFLVVSQAESEDVHMKDLQQSLGITPASASRNIAYLSKEHRLGKPGLDLVETYEDPADRRFKRIRLKPKGKQLKTRLRDILE